MARISVTTQKVTRAGLNPTYSAPNADGDIIDQGSVMLHVKNAAGSQITVTVVSAATYDGLDVADVSVVVPAGGERLIGPFLRGTFAQPDDASVGPGRVLVGYSNVASITRAVLSL